MQANLILPDSNWKAKFEVGNRHSSDSNSTARKCSQARSEPLSGILKNIMIFFLQQEIMQLIIIFQRESLYKEWRICRQVWRHRFCWASFRGEFDSYERRQSWKKQEIKINHIAVTVLNNTLHESYFLTRDKIACQVKFSRSDSKFNNYVQIRTVVE